MINLSLLRYRTASGMRTEPSTSTPQQKCDAKRPCTPCVDTDKTVECIYDNLGPCHHQIRRILPRSGAREDRSQGSGSSSFETLSAVEEGVIRRPANSPSTSVAPSGHCGSTLGLTSTDFGQSSASSELPLPVATSLDLVLSREAALNRNSCGNPATLSFISPLLFPKVSPVPHTPLSFLGEPNLQVSGTTPRELELML